MDTWDVSTFGGCGPRCCECGQTHIWESLCVTSFVYTRKWGCQAEARSVFASPVNTWFHTQCDLVFCSSPERQAFISSLAPKRDLPKAKQSTGVSAQRDLVSGVFLTWGFPDLGRGSLLDCSPVRVAPTSHIPSRLCPSIVGGWFSPSSHPNPS